MKSREQLLYDIGILSFMVVELGEFVDTHPTETGAQEHLKYYVRMLQQKKREFAAVYYPLDLECADNKDWTWLAGPLPWEGGCA